MPQFRLEGFALPRKLSTGLRWNGGPLTVHPLPLSQEERIEHAAEMEELSAPRSIPESCPDGPCPLVSCRHHLWMDVMPNGNIKLNFPDLEPWEMEETCSLRVAEDGSHTLEEVGALLNLTRERVRQIEEGAMQVFKRRMP